jgi:uncharacterized membrane protein
MVVLALSPVCFGKEYTMFRYGPGAFHHPVFAALFLALLAALVVLGVIAVVRMWSNPRRAAPFQGGTPPGPPIDPALTELRVRYARGDITWDEYAQRAHNLGYPPPPGPGPGPGGPSPEAQAPPGSDS